MKCNNYSKTLNNFQNTNEGCMFALSKGTPHCGMMKLADMPSCLGGEEYGINLGIIN